MLRLGMCGTNDNESEGRVMVLDIEPPSSQEHFCHWVRTTIYDHRLSRMGASAWSKSWR
ncbi:hypothetical protein [Actinomadura sp. NPDC048394]|uniref:hypothetical protein n=1 Tax=Actinomadura sp. NPDC048394 TaxID=3158223 RepID=UPI00340F5315